jgi:hypothetical protein
MRPARRRAVAAGAFLALAAAIVIALTFPPLLGRLPSHTGAAPKPRPVATAPKLPCPNGRPARKPVYLADTVGQNHFGPSLYAGHPNDDPAVKPPVKPMVAAIFHVVCVDPSAAKADVGAAVPNWQGLHGPFPWADAIRQFTHGQWAKAKVVWHDVPPAGWTMMMVPQPRGPPNTRPSTYITLPHLGGWYIDVQFGAHLQEYRISCGGQPSLTIPGFHIDLNSVFETR